MGDININVYQGKTRKMRSPFTRFFFSRIFPLIFFAVGLGLSYKGYSTISLAKESLDWPSTTGKIILSEIRHKSSRSGKGNRTSSYHADIKYTYTIGTMLLTGDRVSYGDYGSSDRGHASSIVRRYPVAKKVRVYYMKDQPAEAVLEPGITGSTWIQPVIGLVFAVVGVIMFIRIPGLMNKNNDNIESIT
ncbi:MAG: DUF3592 domain-containing protein [Candidatus Delongbacteria bacterium]|nr:DUF3592 domain-containing protein [Candidatus Delongbacteria bacterium]